MAPSTLSAVASPVRRPFISEATKPGSRSARTPKRRPERPVRFRWARRASRSWSSRLAMGANVRRTGVVDNRFS